MKNEFNVYIKFFFFFDCVLKFNLINSNYRQSWEQQPVHIKRKDSDYYKFLLSTPMMDTILREQHVLFTKNVDVTSYTNGMRETHNPPGRALPSIVWDFFGNDCSIRMLNPQTFVPQLHDLNGKNLYYFHIYTNFFFISLFSLASLKILNFKFII